MTESCIQRQECDLEIVWKNQGDSAITSRNQDELVNTETAKEQPDNEKESHPGW
jgi:hypothetical protein